MADQLRAGDRMLAFGESGEMHGVDCTRKTEGIGELALPLSERDVPLLPVVLLWRSELPGVIGLRLPCVQCFGDGEHSRLNLRMASVRLERHKEAGWERGL